LFDAIVHHYGVMITILDEDASIEGVILTVSQDMIPSDVDNLTSLGHDTILEILGDGVVLDGRVLSSDADTPPGAIVNRVVENPDMFGQLKKDAVCGYIVYVVVTYREVRTVEF